MTDKEEMGASLFSRSLDLMEDDPLEEIFALNIGDFVSEYLISEDLANKIGKDVKDKTARLKSQLKELVSIYSLDNTLCVLGFSSQDEYSSQDRVAHAATRSVTPVCLLAALGRPLLLTHMPCCGLSRRHS